MSFVVLGNRTSHLELELELELGFETDFYRERGEKGVVVWASGRRERETRLAFFIAEEEGLEFRRNWYLMGP